MIERWIVLAAEEAGPVSNKMGGIWNVVDAEATTLARLVARGDIEEGLHILVAGPNYLTSGSDWNTGRNRVTDLSEFEPLQARSELQGVLAALNASGIETATGQRMVEGVSVGYVLFNTNYYQSHMVRWNGQEMTQNNAIKTEAFDLAGLDSMNFERAHYGSEYNHYLNLSYAVSELVRGLAQAPDEMAQKYADKAISEFAKSVMPKVRVSIHCHEFGVFYAAARLKKLGVPVRTVCTLHATVPGRTAGYKSLQKIAQSDSKMEPGTPLGFAVLEGLARYADVVTFVGDSTMKEAMLFHRLKGIVIRNGIDVQIQEIDWDKKESCRARIQQFLTDNLYKYCDGKCVKPENIIPIFTISRIEIENKGYIHLLDALVLQDHLLKHRLAGQRHAEETRVVCFLIASHGPKDKEKLPDGFPINLTPEVLVGEEIRLENMIKERGLDESELISGKRMVAALLYPQWVGPDDGGLAMSVDEIMAGCVAGIFPSQYEPFLLTALEAGREGTPNIVSRSAGYSDALKKIKRRVPGMGGVVIVDNIEAQRQETVLDYALALDYFTWTYLDDEVKYRLLCEESFSLAKQFAWTEPVLEYYRNL
ncbi:MAG: Glycogen synthase [Methanosaeta sp. PtaU1.Bin112]|nr:MAG: Glycogen synthase [Methanosaeta sp. PtaU1.Bin112]